MAAAMHFAMVSPAERHRELIADLSAKCWRLGKSQMVRIGRPAATDKTRLLGN
jgi:hypothetical protein